jgi:ribosome maturation factor RimP
MRLRKITAQILTFAVFHVSMVAAAAPTPTDLQQRVALFGVGTELDLKLTGGEKVRGAVESIGDDSFTVTSRADGAQRQIAFQDLQSVRYPKRGYKAEGAPDPAAARRMVVQLGVGEHIMVQVSPEKKVRGHITKIQEDHFVILPDGETSPLEVPYSSIWKVNKNLSFGATLAILAGVAAATVLILVLSGEDEINVLPD